MLCHFHSILISLVREASNHFFLGGGGGTEGLFSNFVQKYIFKFKVLKRLTIDAGVALFLSLFSKQGSFQWKHITVSTVLTQEEIPEEGEQKKELSLNRKDL